MMIPNPLSLTVLILAFLQAPDPMADGIKALEGNHYDAAAAAFKQAVEKDPKDYAAHFHLALSYSLLKNDSEAAKAIAATNGTEVSGKVISVSAARPQVHRNAR